MKLTRNGFRVKCGIAAVLIGVALLPMVDWSYMHARFTSPIYTWLHTSLWERKQNDGFFVAAVAMIVLGVSVCFEFAGDPAPRKDPWEE